MGPVDRKDQSLLVGLLVLELLFLLVDLHLRQDQMGLLGLVGQLNQLDQLHLVGQKVLVGLSILVDLLGQLHLVDLLGHLLSLLL